MEILAGLAALATVALVSALADAPIQGPADPAGVPAEGVKAPWIFVGIQLVLRWMPPLYAGVVLPLAALVLIGSVSYFRRDSSRAPLPMTVIFFSVVVLMVTVTVWGYLL
jgi:hypothetical protein